MNFINNELLVTVGAYFVYFV